MEYLQPLANEVGMPYVNITLDAGAAISAYKYFWNNYYIFNTVIILPGDFHLMKENFKVNFFFEYFFLFPIFPNKITWI